MLGKMSSLTEIVGLLREEKVWTVLAEYDILIEMSTGGELCYHRIHTRPNTAMGHSVVIYRRPLTRREWR